MTRSSQTILLTILLISSLVLIGSSSVAHASTIPPSIINSDTTWTATNSPYELSGPTLVPLGVTLTIEPGVFINLKEYYLQINGTLRAIGTSPSPITFNGSTGNAGAIKFASSTNWNEQTGTGSIIQNAFINQTVISVTDCSIKISDNTINDATGMMNSNSAINTHGGSSMISNNQFISSGLDVSDSSIITNNVITGGIGLYRGSPQVTKNTISGGSSYFFIGRSFDRDYNTLVISCSATVSENNILGSIILNGYQPVSALITGNTISGMIMDGEGSVNLTISNNKCGPINLDVTTSLTITHNLIVDAETALTIGNATVKDNTLANSKTAIYLNSQAMPTLSGNNLLNSSQCNLKLAGALNVDASNNYWGTNDQTAISTSIYDKKNDFNLGAVAFTPFLTTANPNAPSLDYLPVPDLSPTPMPQTPTPQPNTPEITPQLTPQPTDISPQQSSPPNTNTPLTDLIVIPLLVGIIIILVAIILLTNRKHIANLL